MKSLINSDICGGLNKINKQLRKWNKLTGDLNVRSGFPFKYICLLGNWSWPWTSLLDFAHPEFAQQEKSRSLHLLFDGSPHLDSLWMGFPGKFTFCCELLPWIPLQNRRWDITQKYKITYKIYWKCYEEIGLQSDFPCHLTGPCSGKKTNPIILEKLKHFGIVTSLSSSFIDELALFCDNMKYQFVSLLRRRGRICDLKKTFLL